MKTQINPAVAKTTVVEVSPETITVTLTKHEAGVLASILGKVGSGFNQTQNRMRFCCYCNIMNIRIHTIEYIK